MLQTLYIRKEGYPMEQLLGLWGIKWHSRSMPDGRTGTWHFSKYTSEGTTGILSQWCCPGMDHRDTVLPLPADEGTMLFTLLPDMGWVGTMLFQNGSFGSVVQDKNQSDDLTFRYPSIPNSRFRFSASQTEGFEWFYEEYEDNYWIRREWIFAKRINGKM